MPKLTENTVVVDPNTGGHVVLYAGQDAPEWAFTDDPDEADLIGAHLLDGPVEKAAATDPDAPPPTSGRGSGTDAWQKYADDRNITYPEGAGRDEIIAAVEAHRAGQ